MLLEHHHIDSILRQTGIPFRFGMNVCHWNILPRSNLRTWSTAEQSTRESAAMSIGGLITHTLVKSDFSIIAAEPGKGFRVYTGSGTDTFQRKALTP